MKNIVIVSVLCSLMVASAAFADSAYSPATPFEYANRYTQQAAQTANQVQSNVQQVYQNGQQVYQAGQQMYQQGQQAVQNAQQLYQNANQTYQNLNQMRPSKTDVQQAGQSYIDHNTQPIRQKTSEMVESWSNQSADWQAKADANLRTWNQTIRSYEANYNESYNRNWDKFTDAYQKSKKL